MISAAKQVAIDHQDDANSLCVINPVFSCVVHVDVVLWKKINALDFSNAFILLPYRDLPRS
jgi:hypothetical protein